MQERIVWLFFQRTNKQPGREEAWLTFDIEFSCFCMQMAEKRILLECHEEMNIIRFVWRYIIIRIWRYGRLRNYNLRGSRGNKLSGVDVLVTVMGRVDGIIITGVEAHKCRHIYIFSSLHTLIQNILHEVHIEHTGRGEVSTEDKRFKLISFVLNGQKLLHFRILLSHIKLHVKQSKLWSSMMWRRGVWQLSAMKQCTPAALVLQGEGRHVGKNGDRIVN
jgi:hypothetical protein